MTRDLCVFSCGPKTIKLIFGPAEGAAPDIHFSLCLNRDRGVVGPLQRYVHMPECQGGLFCRPKTVSAAVCFGVHCDFLLFSAFQHHRGAFSAGFHRGFFSSPAGQGQRLAGFIIHLSRILCLYPLRVSLLSQLMGSSSIKHRCF